MGGAGIKAKLNQLSKKKVVKPKAPSEDQAEKPKEPEKPADQEKPE